MDDPLKTRDKLLENRILYWKCFKYLLIVFNLFAFVFTAKANSITLISWNIKDFGQTRDDKEIQIIAEVLKSADLVAIQEVVAKHPGGAQAVGRLAEALNRMGSKWDYVISDPTKSTSPYKSERYAFLWKTQKIKTHGRPYLLRALESEIEREPFVGEFFCGKLRFRILNYHSCTHTADGPEVAEIKSISSWLLRQNQSCSVWLGDFNLDIRHPVYQHLLQNKYKFLVENQKTTLKMTCDQGNYLSLGEDNILYQCKALELISFHVYDFIRDYSCEDVSWLRNSLSDHLPLVAKFNIL